MENLTIHNTLNFSGLDPLNIDSSIKGDSLEVLSTDKTISESTLESLSTDNRIVDDPLLNSEKTTDISKTPLENFTPSMTIETIGGMNPPIISKEILQSAVESFRPDSQIVPVFAPGDFQPGNPDSSLLLSPMESLAVNNSVEEIKFNILQVDSRIAYDPLEAFDGKRIIENQNDGFDSLEVETKLSSNSVNLTGNIPSKEIKQNPIEKYAPSKFITEIKLDPLEKSTNIAESKMEPYNGKNVIENENVRFEFLAIDNTLPNPNVEFTGVTPNKDLQVDFLQPYFPDTTITQGKLDFLSSMDNTLLKGGFDPLQVNKEITNEKMDSYEPKSEIDNMNVRFEIPDIHNNLLESTVNFDGVTPKTEILKDPLKDYAASIDISRGRMDYLEPIGNGIAGGGLEDLRKNEELSTNEMEASGPKNYIENQNARFEEANTKNEFIEKSVNFEAPTVPSPKISPKNVFKRR
jgi:hypothetical protein